MRKNGKKRRRPSYPSLLRQIIGILIVPTTLVGLDVAAGMGMKFTGSGLVVLVLLIFVSCWSGLRAGIIASLLIVAYLPIAYNTPGSVTYHVDDFERRFIGVIIVFPLTALIAGIVQNKLRAAALRTYEAHDVASREAMHRETAEQLKSIVVETSKDAIIATDQDGLVTVWNPSAEELFGWARGEVIGRPLSEELIPVSARGKGEHGLDALRLANPSLAIGNRLELIALNRNGKELDVELTLAAHDSQNGRTIVGFVRDVSLEKKMQQELLMNQKLESIGQLAGGIAHDFNNVLSVIVGFGELARSDVPTDHPVQNKLDEILRAARRCFDINKQLLAFARRQPQTPQVVSINEVVEGVRPLLGTLLREDIEVTMKLAEDLFPVRADASQIEQVVTNLVINARDAMPNGGRLTIETRNTPVERGAIAELSQGEYATLSVTDTGTGIAPEHMDKVFEPFFTTKTDKGTGLGLASSYGIAKRAGGRISIYSELGHGSTFRLYLPKTDGQVEHITARHEPADIKTGSETILIAEDNLQVRSMIEQTLKHFGYKVLTAGSGEEALSIAADHPFDLLVTDLIMPKMGGTELVQRLRESVPELRVVFLSGYTEEKISGLGVAGVQGGFLQKPVLPMDLAAKVRELLDGKK